MTAETDADDTDCACGKPVEEVSFAHYLSCGPDAAFTPEEADGFVGRVVARVERSISRLPSQGGGTDG